MKIYRKSVKGPKKKVLQDASAFWHRKDYSVFVVSDGLGSALNSDFGSKSVLVAVRKAAKEWIALKKKDEKVLLQLIHFYWNLEILDSEFDKKDCLSTCLFAIIIHTEKRVILGQLGDGLICYKSDNKEEIISSNTDYNYTKALGASTKIEDWNLVSAKINLADFKLLMATDGVSEDIVENKEIDFTISLVENLTNISKNSRTKYIKRMLENWPTRFHSDDKTILIAWGRS